MAEKIAVRLTVAEWSNLITAVSAEANRQTNSGAHGAALALFALTIEINQQIDAAVKAAREAPPLKSEREYAQLMEDARRADAKLEAAYALLVAVAEGTANLLAEETILMRRDRAQGVRNLLNEYLNTRK